MKKYMLPLISATLCCATVLATDRTAETANHPTGGTGNWWLTADNWTPVGVPGDSDDFILFAFKMTVAAGRNGVYCFFIGHVFNTSRMVSSTGTLLL